METKIIIAIIITVLILVIFAVTFVSIALSSKQPPPENNYQHNNSVNQPLYKDPIIQPQADQKLYFGHTIEQIKKMSNDDILKMCEGQPMCPLIAFPLRDGK